MSVESLAGHLIELAALAALLAAPLGTVPGILAALGALTAVTVTYLSVLRSRLVRWGAADEEVAWPLPGDDIAAPAGRCTTRAVTIGTPAGQVWPWIAQLGYGRAGWYSDHLSHASRQRSAAQIRPEWQQLGPGDRILLVPGSGLDVITAEDGHYFVARTPDGTMSWCLEVKPVDQHSCRLISRWRRRWLVTAASAPWTALSDPGSFVTERRMLLGIKLRAEKAAQPGLVPCRSVLRRVTKPGWHMSHRSACGGWPSAAAISRGFPAKIKLSAATTAAAMRASDVTIAGLVGPSAPRSPRSSATPT